MFLSTVMQVPEAKAKGAWIGQADQLPNGKDGKGKALKGAFPFCRFPPEMPPPLHIGRAPVLVLSYMQTVGKKPGAPLAVHTVPMPLLVDTGQVLQVSARSQRQHSCHRAPRRRTGIPTRSPAAARTWGRRGSPERAARPGGLAAM